MARLPNPGSDEGTWGNILNDFLSQAHAPDGTLKPGSVDSASLGTGTVATSNLADNAVTGGKLDAATQSTLSQVASKYTKPSSGIPATDLDSASQASLTKAASSVQSVNTKTPNGSGAVTLTAADVGAATQLVQLTDVNAAGPNNGQVLSYDTPSSKWIASTVTSTTVTDATASTKGILQLSGDLGGTAATPTVPGLAAKAPLASPTFSGTVTVPTPTNPTDATTKAYVDSAASTGTPDATAITKGKLQLAGDLSGTAASPTVAKVNGITLPASGPTSGQVLTATSTTATGWSTPPSAPVSSVAGKTGAVTLTSSDVGLGNVDNTSDVNKPVSTAQQTALNAKANTATTMSAGTGLSGGGDLTANRSLSANFGTTAGTIAQGNDARITGAEQAANKGAASGYAPLDSGSKVPTTNLGGAGADNTKYLRGDQSWTTLPAAPVTSVASKTGAVTLASTDLTDAAALETTAHASASYVATVAAPTGVAATDTGAIQAALTAIPAGGGRVLLRDGAYAVNAALTFADHTSLEGNGYGTRITFSGSGTLASLTNQFGVSFRNLRVTLSNATGVAFDVSNAFRCTWVNCTIDGQHTSATGSTYQTQYGFKLRNNAGDNRIINCDLNNLGIGVRTDTIMNYMVGCVVGTCWRGIYGGDPTGVIFTAGMSVSDTTFTSTAAATDRHVYVEGTASMFWFLNVWMEGASTAVEIGAGTYGPYNLTMQGLIIAATVKNLVINACRQAGLFNITMDKDTGQTPTEVTIDATNAANGAAVNIISKQVFDYAAGVFPTTWQYIGRSAASMPTTTFAAANNVFTGSVPNAQGVAAGVFPGILSTPRVVLSDGTNSWAYDLFGGNILRFFQPGSGDRMALDSAGNLRVGGSTADTAGAAKALAIPNGTTPTSSPSAGSVLFSSGGRVKVRSSDGTTALVSDAANRYQMGAIARYYMNPLAPNIRTTAPTLNRLLLHPFYSGANGVTLSKLDVVTTVASGVGGNTRLGVYQITDQSRPFLWAVSTAWADLLVDGGTVSTEGTTGQKELTLGSPLVIPANTWFAVGGVEQVSAATRNVGGQAGFGGYSPLGSPGTTGYGATVGLALYQDAVSGALPSSFVPAGVLNLDSGVGAYRSA